ELDAEHPFAAPDHLAALAALVGGHQRKLEGVADIDLGIDGDLGAAGRDINHRAGLGRLAVEREPGLAAMHLASRFAVDLEPSLVHSHDVPCSCAHETKLGP